MVMDNFPNGIKSFGVPVIGGIGGIPLTGNWYFCDYLNGSDGYDGSVEMPFKTIGAAYAKAVSGNNDVIVIVGDGGTTATQRLSETLTWAKDATHLIGMTAPTMLNQRARISHLTTATTNINPLISVTASGCMFLNFSVYQGIGQATTDEQLLSVTGHRNYFGNIHFAGMCAAAGAARAGSWIINIAGGQENTFDSCVIGQDTIARSAANASVKLSSAATRNVFRRCLFPVYATATSPYIVDANAVGAVDRYNLIQDGAVLNTGTSDIASAVAFHASQGGIVMIDKCTSVGLTAWTGSSTATVYVSSPAPAASGAGGIATHV